MEPDQQALIEDLEALNEIAGTLNQAVDMHSALDRALAHLVKLMDLETGWIFIRDEDDTEKWWGKGFGLVAHHNLPPALALDREEAWRRSCDCQNLGQRGDLEKAYNEVKCSRLAAVHGDRRELSVHASAPLRAGDRTLGILNVAAASWDAFSPRALALLSNVGSQIGVALERARLFDLLQEQRFHEQASLLDFTNQLLSRLDLEDLIAYLVEEARKLLEIDACALLLPDDDDPDYLRFAAASGWFSDPVAAERRVPADDRTSSGRVMRTQEPIVLEDIALRETAPWMADWLPAEKFKAAAIVPLIADGRSIGSLVVDSRTPQPFQEDEMRFLQLMANQAAIALEKARLHHEEIQRYRLEEELSVGRQIQLSMLPPSLPHIPGWDFAARYEAARQVGGDFYDYFEVPDPSGDEPLLGLVMADVADKGVPAALFMALSRTTIRNVAISDRTPAAALRKANELILKDSQTDLFLTAFYATLDTWHGQVIYTNAGHNPPLWYALESGTFMELTADGIALGVVPDIELENRSLELAPGDLLIFYTDGVTEAMNSEMEEFGVARLRETIAAAAGQGAQAVCDQIVEAVITFTEAMPKWDDFTLLIARRELD